jgi:hypothetical protein
MKNLKRDPSVFSARIVVNGVMSGFLGAIFHKVGETSPAVFSNLQSHFGAVVSCSVLTMIATGQTALLTFPSERPVFLREYTTDHYSVTSYFMSRLVVDAIVTSILSMCLVRQLHFFRLLLPTYFYAISDAHACIFLYI